MGRTIAKGVQPIPLGAALPIEIQTTNFNADSNKAYFCNTTSSTITLLLPLNPVMGDTVRVFDVAGAFDTNNLTIGRNGKPIMGLAEDLTVSTEGAAFDLVFYDDVQGWRLYTI